MLNIFAEIIILSRQLAFYLPEYFNDRQLHLGAVCMISIKDTHIGMK